MQGQATNYATGAMRMAFWDEEPTLLALYWTKILRGADERVRWSGPHEFGNPQMCSCCGDPCKN